MLFRFCPTVFILCTWLHSYGTRAYPTRYGEITFRGKCRSGVSSFRNVTLSVDGEEKCHQCGQHCCVGEKRKRIIHGDNALEGEFPWHAAVYRYEEELRGWKLSCGGVLVSPHYVLTSAHCVDRFCAGTASTSAWRASIGEVNINLDQAGVRRDSNGLLEFEDVQCHGRYGQTDGTNNYDVAVIRLREKSHHPTVCINMDRVNAFTNNRCFGIGHGKTRSSHRFGSSRLQKVPTDFVRLRNCERIYEANLNSDIHACASTKKHKTYVGCNMDSGSPIVCPQDPNDACSPYVVYGLFSNKPRVANCRDRGASLLTNLYATDGPVSLANWVSGQIGLETADGCEDLK